MIFNGLSEFALLYQYAWAETANPALAGGEIEQRVINCRQMIIFISINSTKL